MTSGVTLIAIGRFGYLQWAINMAVSLKYHSPDIAIQLITSRPLQADAEIARQRYGIFDVITPVADERYTMDGKLFPARLKTDFYYDLEFDETIYLDVDGIVIRDIAPLFNQLATGPAFATDIQGLHKITDGNTFNAMKWAKPDDVWQHFGLTNDAVLPAINSSFMYIRKSDMCESLFNKASALLMSRPLPVEKHWHPWGQRRKTKIAQPDELYFNVALAKLNIVPAHVGAIHFRMVTETGEAIPFADLQKSYYGIGLFGELRINHNSLQEYYNKHMRQCWANVVTAKTGEAFSAKCEILSQSKFVIQ